MGVKSWQSKVMLDDTVLFATCFCQLFGSTLFLLHLLLPCLAGCLLQVLFEQKKALGVIVLNRPKALNALNMNMIHTTLPMLRVRMPSSANLTWCSGSRCVRACVH